MLQLSKRKIDLKAIRLLVTDMDGVWTDGSIYLDDSGVEMLRFSAYDGLAVKLARDGGLRLAVLSARRCPAVFFRLTRLGEDEIHLGSPDKAVDFPALCRRLGVEPAQAAYLGDDLPDLGAMRLAGVALTVAQAPEEMRQAADYVTEAPGGSGAVREAVEWLLRQTGRWTAVLAGYGAPARRRRNERP
jgi:3-deoxy-D-manno-octulosonate 8-phosphate phosphatase (KDO 8-P phosphatase)